MPGRGKRQEQGLSPVLVRMRAAYPDLRYGPFVSLADFESPAQARLFRVVAADGSEGQRRQPSLSVLRSRNQTGAGGLKVELAGPGDRLLLDGRRSRKLALIRDWGDYALLLMSIYGPRGGVTLELAVRSGVEAPLHWRRRIRVAAGWNLYRFDLAELGEWVDLADVRALSWQAPEIEAPLEIFLDDLILADNSHYLLGAQAGAGELYVLERGCSIHVGARGRFELAFRDGVITSWRCGGLENLTVSSGLGPFPVPLSANWFRPGAPALVYDDPQLLAHWGPVVATGQRLVEMSAFRVVLRGRWRFVSAPGAAGAEALRQPAPGHAWSYTIYPSGQVYVAVSSSSAGRGWKAPQVGYVVALDGRRGFKRVAASGAGGGAASAGFVLMCQPGSERPDLLWCPQDRRLTGHLLELASADERRVALLCGALPAAESLSSAHLLRFWPPDIDAAPEAESLALDYQHPARLRVSAGRRVSDAAGDLDGDGYNESQGCYELAAEGGILRFRFEPGGRLRHRPVFRVRGTAGRRCWVYADGRIVAPLGRDGSGALLFGLGRGLSGPRAVEVVSAGGSE